MPAHPDVVGKRAAEEDIVPAAHIEGGDVDLPVLPGDIEPIPVAVERGMVEPCLVVGSVVEQVAIVVEGVWTR